MHLGISNGSILLPAICHKLQVEKTRRSIICNERIRPRLSGLTRLLIQIISSPHSPSIELLTDVCRLIVVFLFINIFASPILLFSKLSFVFCCKVAAISGSHAIFSLLNPRLLSF